MPDIGTMQSTWENLSVLRKSKEYDGTSLKRVRKSKDR